MKFIAEKAASLSGDVLEVGSLNINGSPRELFLDPRFRSYLGVDLNAGPGVDMVMDCHCLALPGRSVDVVVDAERLEHDSDFFASYREIRRVLRPGGHVIVTTRSWGGFHPHCLPGDYWRFLEGGLRRLFEVSGLESVEIRYGEFWEADRMCFGCPEHQEPGPHHDIFAHGLFGFAKKPVEDAPALHP